MKWLLKTAFSGEGAVIVQLLGLGIGSWLASSILTAIGKGQIGRFIQVISVFLAISLAIGSIGKVINKIL